MSIRTCTEEDLKRLLSDPELEQLEVMITLQYSL